MSFFEEGFGCSVGFGIVILPCLGKTSYKYSDVSISTSIKYDFFWKSLDTSSNCIINFTWNFTKSGRKFRGNILKTSLIIKLHRRNFGRIQMLARQSASAKAISLTSPSKNRVIFLSSVLCFHPFSDSFFSHCHLLQDVSNAHVFRCTLNWCGNLWKWVTGLQYKWPGAVHFGAKFPWTLLDCKTFFIRLNFRTCQFVLLQIFFISEQFLFFRRGKKSFLQLNVLQDDH